MEKMIASNRALFTVLALLFLTPVGCGGEGDDKDTDVADGSADTLDTADDTANGVPTITADVAANYAAIVYASYQDTLAAAQSLDAAVDDVLAAPSQAGLNQAREEWRAAREPYLQTEVYRFYEGPIDNEDDGPEGLINAWPLDEAYIDYVEDDPMAGIINDPDVEISAAELESLNEQGGEDNIATGYHAIEFLLWGQDMNQDGPGDRPYTDYLTDGSGTAANQDRRGQYLTIVSDMLVGHLQQLVEAWEPDTANYRAEFEGAANREVLRRMLTGMIVLSGFETGGERLQTALDSGDQEDEHSCFSDNTHRDMVQDIQGMQNVYLGTYTRTDGTRISGPGLKDVIAARDQQLAQDIENQIAESLRLANALQPPFDQEIAPGNMEGRARVQALIVSLRTQEGMLEDAFRLFELTIPAVE